MTFCCHFSYLCNRYCYEKYKAGGAWTYWRTPETEDKKCGLYVIGDNNEKSINYKHALKNGLIPVITIAGINIGTLIAFSIITETVFQWPGMGFLFIQAVQFVDIPIMSAYLVFIAFVFVMINFIVDILYYLIDPRIRVKGDTASG